MLQIRNRFTYASLIFAGMLASGPLYAQLAPIAFEPAQIEGGASALKPKFFIAQFRVGSTDKCLGIEGGSKSSGALMIQTTCGDEPSQKFRVIQMPGDLHQIIPIHSGMRSFE